MIANDMNTIELLVFWEILQESKNEVGYDALVAHITHSVTPVFHPFLTYLIYPALYIIDST